MTIQDDNTAPVPGYRSEPGSFPAQRSRRRRTLRLTTAAAVALGLAVGGSAVASASGSTTSTTPAPHGGHDFGGTPPTAFGTVASVGANTFTLTTHDGTTVTVDVTSSTTYVDRAVTSPSLADVTVGAHVAVFGTKAASTVTATKVAVGGPDGDGPGQGPGGPGFGGTRPAAFGTVASVGANTFTLTTHDGTTVTVDVTSSTTYREDGVTSPSLGDVKVGTMVVVFGTDTANTVTATSVGIGAPHGPMGGPGDGDGNGPPVPGGSTTGSSGTSSVARTGASVLN